MLFDCLVQRVLPDAHNMFLARIYFDHSTIVYMKPALGAGPKDALFVIFAKRKIPVAIAKNSIEAVVFVIGWILGGTIGIGTVVAVFAMGYIIQFWFNVFNFDVTKVENESVFETAKNIKGLLQKNK